MSARLKIVQPPKPRQVKITFSAEPDGRKPSVILYFASPFDEEEFVKRVCRGREDDLVESIEVVDNNKK